MSIDRTCFGEDATFEESRMLIVFTELW